MCVCVCVCVCGGGGGWGGLGLSTLLLLWRVACMFRGYCRFFAKYIDDYVTLTGKLATYHIHGRGIGLPGH